MQTKQEKQLEPEEEIIEEREYDPEIDGDFEVTTKMRKRVLKKLFDKIVSPIVKVLDGIELDYSDSSRMRKSFIAMLKLKVPISILLVIVILMSAGYFFLDSGKTAYTEMSLNYEESAYGLNPNSTRFNIYDVSSPEVVKKMLTYCGIDPDDVDINEVIDCISVSPMNAKAFSEENLFISTTFKIKMKKPDCIKNINVKTLLSFLCKAYKDNLYSKYTENRSILAFDIDRFDDDEYMVIADLLDLKAQQIEKYLNTRVKQTKSFTEQSSDATFKSLVQKVEDIRNYDIAKYRSFVKQAGCTHDKSNYTRSLAYVNRIKGIDYSKDMAAYTVYNAGIKIYDDSMTNVVMIPSIDQEKSTYYMSRTKTGMDYMAKKANDHLVSAQAIEKEISVNNYLIDKMSSIESTPENLKKADNMIKDIRLKFSVLSKEIEKIDKAYIKYKTKDYLTFKTTNASLLQKIQPEMLFVIAIAVLCAVYAAIWLRSRLLYGGKTQ